MTTATASPLTRVERIFSLTAVIATACGVGLSFGIGIPLTALTFEARGEPAWIIGIAGASPAVAMILVLPFLPRLLVRVGSVAAMIGGCAIGAIGFVALFAFPKPESWIVIRLLMSAGLALPWLAGEMWINSVSADGTRGRVIAAYSMAYFAGISSGPLILQYTGLTGFLPFLFGATGTAAAVVPIVLARRLAPALSTEESGGLLSAVRTAPAAMTSAFVAGFAEVGVLSMLPNVGIAAGLSENTALGLVSITAAGGIILQLPLGWISDVASKLKLVICIALLFILLVLALPFALADPIASSVVAFLIGGASLAFYMLALAMLGASVRTASLAAANASLLILYQVGGIFGPIVSGLAMTRDPVSGFVITMSAIMAMAIAALVRIQLRIQAADRD